MAEPSRDTKSASMGAKVPDAEKPVPDRQFRWLRGKTAVVTGGAGWVTSHNRPLLYDVLMDTFP